MDQTMLEQLPAIAIYAVLPEQAMRVSPLLTDEAVNLVAGGKAFTLCAVEDGEACGAICAYLSAGQQGVLELVSLYVAPPHRRRRIGATLVRELLDQVNDCLGGELRMVRASFASAAADVRGLLERMGFVCSPIEEACDWYLPVAALASAPLLQKNAGSGKGVLRSFAGLTAHQIKQIYWEIQRYDANQLTLKEFAAADPGYSFALWDAAGSLRACVVLRQQEEDKFCLQQFFCQRGYAGAAIAVLQAAARALLHDAPPQAELEIPTVAVSAMQMVQRLLSEEKTAQGVTEAVLRLDALPPEEE